MLAHQTFDGPQVWHGTPTQDAQKGRPARPQRVKGRGVPSGYVEGLNDARTMLAGFFSFLLKFDCHQVLPHHDLSPERFPCLFLHIVSVGDRIEV